MFLHGLGVGVGHHQGCALVQCRADRAEDAGILMALIGDLARARAFRNPLINLTVLLANPRFILEP